MPPIALIRTGSGPAMLLVHGLPGTHTVWSPLLAELARHRTVVAVDLPGFGGSPAPEDRRDLSLPRLADRLLALATEQGFERFDLAGHSFGAAVAATMAVRSPERIRSLTLLAPMGFDVPPLARLGRWRPIVGVIHLLWRIVPRALRRRAVTIGVRLNYGDAYDLTRAGQIAAELDRDDAISQIFRTISAVDFREYQRTVEQLDRMSAPPVLLLTGGSDRIIPTEQSLRYASTLPRAAHHHQDDGVHVLMWQRPEPVAQTIREFVG